MLYLSYGAATKSDPVFVPAGRFEREQRDDGERTRRRRTPRPREGRRGTGTPSKAKPPTIGAATPIADDATSSAASAPAVSEAGKTCDR